MDIFKLENYQIDEFNNQQLLNLSNDINMPTSSQLSNSQSIQAGTSSTADTSLSSLSASLTAAFVQQMSHQNSKPLLYSFVTLEGNKYIFIIIIMKLLSVYV
jgi:hypothetical protein